MTNNAKHWDGAKNKAVRLYFYSQRGLGLFNEFRYLFMLIFGVYLTCKMTNPLWMVLMFLIACPVLIVAGWIQVHKMAATINWLDIEFGSYWSRYSFELQERQVNALESINNKAVPIAECPFRDQPLAHEAHSRNFNKEIKNER